ncbi:DUF502 domain-containing protein [Halorubrum ezzemoulense]|uniref:DUF502 domain-containing protein n=1 Tax=Halorubrum ezzemoulense TaxID=337243 RepID=UPI00232F8A24|nr:DUF502 domain-containing protein [Halorubrum ezzemoulense]MDB9251094.1 DUF502 domain-containing protein [Halorubrum ezzemoulense]MDB9255502.1 DUF502 domain-containing protein [Halorubrum ezzemoulense]MDB9276213.1 DUF502 domain-containing protein [Halorubrum ezzemoulense]
MTDESSGVELLRRAFLTGVAVIVPAVITLAVLAFAFNAVYDYLDAFSSAVVAVTPGAGLPVIGAVSRETAIEVATPVVFVAAILLVGAGVESSRYGERAVDYVDDAVERVPGVGSVYQGFRQMSDAMLDSEGGNFREVVLVEFPTEETYTLAFVTSETPDVIADHADGDGDGMRTLFMPMAPNPVMGGHVVFVPDRRVVDVELTVDEGIRALVTSGVALEEVAADLDDVDPDDLRPGAPERTIDARFPADGRPENAEEPRDESRGEGHKTGGEGHKTGGEGREGGRSVDER